MTDWAAVDRLLLRDRWIVGGCVGAIAVLAWLWLWREWAAMAPDTSMPGMEMPSAEMASPSDAAAYLASAFIMWFLMMIAMMLPSAAPMIMLVLAEKVLPVGPLVGVAAGVVSALIGLVMALSE